MELKEQLLGTWRLVSLTYQEDGQDYDFMGKNPIGFLVYNADGSMMVQHLSSQRKHLSTNDWTKAPLEEIKEAFISYQAYYGRYEIDIEKKAVLHHIEASLFPNWHLDKVTQIRYFHIDKELLTIFTAPILVLGVERIFKAVWKR